MLINALRIIINKLYQESFNIIFMRKKKTIKKIIILSFFIKYF